ncbi:MAG: DUF4157 domain-containing protein [Novosphingobium sp.]
MTGQTMQQRPAPIASRAAAKGQGSVQRAPKKKLAQMAQKKKPVQLAPRKELMQKAPKKKLAQLAPKKKLAQMAEKKKPAQLAPNRGGLPDSVRNGVEGLSGMSMDHVKVHYNSARPAQFNAHAYAQGSDIHVASGQERHLPHEAWHVVQQAQGRVQPTQQLDGGVPVNNDTRLEKEADVMGARAVQLAQGPEKTAQLVSAGAIGGPVVQRAVPTGTGLPKPVPDTGGYRARANAKQVIFWKANYTRSDFSFGVHTRETVFAKHNPTGIGSHALSVMTTSGHQANPQGVQLDHSPVSWDAIQDHMNAHNLAEKQKGTPENDHDYYTLWDARMYYNDIANLKPAMGSDNASGGAEGAHVSAKMHEFLQVAVGKLQQSMTNLQGVLGAFHESFEESDVVQKSETMIAIAGRLDTLAEDIGNT